MARHRKGSSKSGRPRSKGDRYPSGKLKPRGPNETVMARRKIGDAEAGEHPLDFALSREWITERQHRDAMSYRAAFNIAHICGPRLSNGSLSEVTPSEELRINWAALSDVEITDIFDRIFNCDPEPEDRAKLEAAGLERWKRLNLALTPSEREELFMVCVLGSWPLWMPKKAQDHALGSKDLLKEARLLDGLGSVARALRPPRKVPSATITPLPHRRTRAGRTEVTVRYETEEGDPITAMSERGAPFEVTILRKRA